MNKKEYSQKYQQQNYVKQRRRELIYEHGGAAEINALKEATPCADCQQYFPAVCMDFDHLPEFTKSFNISHGVGSRKSKEERLAEIAKCEIVCANCHRLRTAKRLTPTEGTEQFTQGYGSYNRDKEVCIRGHEFTTENTYWRQEGKYKKRKCRECGRMYVRERRAKRRADFGLTTLSLGNCIEF